MGKSEVFKQLIEVMSIILHREWFDELAVAGKLNCETGMWSENLNNLNHPDIPIIAKNHFIKISAAWERTRVT